MNETPPHGSARLESLAEAFWDATMAAEPSTATMLGDHRFDDQLERLDPATLQARRGDLTATIDAARDLALHDPADLLTRDLLVHEAGEQRLGLGIDLQIGPIDPFLGVHSQLLTAASQISAITADQADMLLARHAQVPRLFDEVAHHNRDRLARGLPPVAVNVERVIGQITDYLATDLDDDPFVAITVPEAVADDFRDRMRRLVTDVVRPAFQDHADFARHVVLPASRDNDHAGLCHLPDGDETYATLARIHTSLTSSPDEMHAIGVTNAQHDLVEEWLTIGRRALGIEGLAELFDRLRTDPALRYDSPAAMVTHAQEVVARAWEHIDGWFNARPKAPCQVLPVPDSLAPAMPPAYYFPPAEDGSRPGTYFINTHEASERQRYPYEAIAFHEAIPGHHFDRTLAQELTDVPTFRRYSTSNAHAEGWGLYTERLADEMGLYSSELDRLGMLMADSWRAGRLVVDTGLHAMG
ncbi:MAG TPA: DUF885 domain-containing protein, partial [Nitriliruptoraceae bacterium]|nr:DUF885 domain-containing protein [Nitriliruptoraceae bacterium]